MTAIATLVVRSLAEGGYLVRGTLDIPAAQDALVAWFHAHDDGGDPVNARIYVSQRLRATAGWYRCNPCACGGDHRWDLGYGQAGQRGAFRGVEFNSPW